MPKSYKTRVSLQLYGFLKNNWYSTNGLTVEQNRELCYWIRISVA